MLDAHVRAVVCSQLLGRWKGLVQHVWVTQLMAGGQGLACTAEDNPDFDSCRRVA